MVKQVETAGQRKESTETKDYVVTSSDELATLVDEIGDRVAFGFKARGVPTDIANIGIRIGFYINDILLEYNHGSGAEISRLLKCSREESEIEASISWYRVSTHKNPYINVDHIYYTGKKKQLNKP